jgi:hypothetical protein
VSIQIARVTISTPPGKSAYSIDLENHCQIDAVQLPTLPLPQRLPYNAAG